MLLSSFGPACALVFGLPTLPASQPLNGLGKLPQTSCFKCAKGITHATATHQLCAKVITLVVCTKEDAHLCSRQCVFTAVGSLIGGLVGLFFRYY